MFTLNPSQEIDDRWCYMGSNETSGCTAFLALAQLFITIFYLTILFVTVLHSFYQYCTGAKRTDDKISRKHDSNWCVKRLRIIICSTPFGMMCFNDISYHFSWSQPVQFWPIQLFGCLIMLVCIFSFLTVHCQLGSNWYVGIYVYEYVYDEFAQCSHIPVQSTINLYRSPVPEAKADHQLVTAGIFSLARHPMYVDQTNSFCAFLIIVAIYAYVLHECYLVRNTNIQVCSSGYIHIWNRLWSVYLYSKRLSRQYI